MKKLLNTKSSTKLDKIFGQWKYECLKDFVERHCRSAKHCYIKDGVWYYNDYRDTEFHVHEFEMAQMKIRNAEPNEIVMHDSYKTLIVYHTEMGD